MSTPTPTSQPATNELALASTSTVHGAVVAEVQPTQLRRPWRSSLRTAFQTAIAVIPILGLVVPEIISIVLEEAGEAMPQRLRLILLAVSAVVVAIAAAASRIMAIPAVELLLRRYRLTAGLAAAPRPTRDSTVPGR